MKFKDNFRLGVASASTQIEGGRVNSNWNWFSDQDKITDHSNVERANNHYELYAQDLKLMAHMGIKDYPFSIEWARIQPSENNFNSDALVHYRDMILEMKELNIHPILTFYHFSHPMWFEEKGAWTKKENIIYFLRFVAKCLDVFGDLVDEYITINEPNVYAVNGHFFGVWPPEKKSLSETIKVMSVFALAHIKAYELIHTIRNNRNFTNTKVSFAHHVRDFATNSNSYLDKNIASLFKSLFQDKLTNAMFLGKFDFPLDNYGKVKQGQYIDFIAINYYTRTTVKNLQEGFMDNCYKNDLGWEIYPQGLITVANELYSVLNVPIYITENGTCDNNDQFRNRYLFDHLEVVNQSNLPIERYYHWCFIDNFEWAEGESARFGLVHNDYETQKRTIKHSGHFYSQIIKEKGISEETYEYYVKNQHYHK